jgi:hypothetical protein
VCHIAHVRSVRAALALGTILLALVALNAKLDAANECDCYPECWCKRPGLRHFRWVVPFSRHKRPID